MAAKYHHIMPNCILKFKTRLSTCATVFYNSDLHNQVLNQAKEARKGDKE